MDDAIRPKRRRGRPPLGPEHRERLIRATLHLLDRKGLEGLQARLIAAEAKLSVGSLYKLVGDIDDVAREAALQTYRALYDHETAIFATVKDRPVREQLLAMARGYVEFVSRHEKRWSAIIARRRAEGLRPEWYDAAETRMFSLITERLSEALPGALAEPDRLMAARALWAAVHGIVTAASHDDGDPAEQEAMITLIIDGVLGELARKAG
ncbi:MAG: TetR/AcrR family transcriptional regulator [Oceanicaulis sp.]